MRKKMIVLLSTFVGVIVGAIGIGYNKEKQMKQKNEKIEKFRNYYDLLNQWLILKQENKNIVQYFLNHGYKTIAIYGMGELGSRLFEDLKNTQIKVKYGIDKNFTGLNSELEIFEIDDQLENVDAVVVSAIFAFQEIKKDLSDKIDYPIISLEDVIYDYE